MVITLPEAEGAGGGGSSQAAGQLHHFLLEASPPPPPHQTSPILLVFPHPSGWLAHPAPLPVPGWALVHLSGTRRLIKPPRKQGQPAGAEEGAALGHVWLQGFFGPCSNLPSRKTGVWVTYLTGCMCTCVFMCVKVGLSRAGSPSNNSPSHPHLWLLRQETTGKGQGQGESHLGTRPGLSKSYSQPRKIGGLHRLSSPGVGAQFLLVLYTLLPSKDPLGLSREGQSYGEQIKLLPHWWAYGGHHTLPGIWPRNPMLSWQPHLLHLGPSCWL